MIYRLWTRSLGPGAFLALLSASCVGARALQAQTVNADSAISYAATGLLPPRTIAGVVYDPKSGLALEGVQVSIEGERIGALTNSRGTFQLEIPNGDTLGLVIQYIGYQTLRAAIELEGDRGVVVRIGLREQRIPMCGLVVCGGEGCGAIVAFVRDALSGVAPKGRVVLRVGGESEADSAMAEPRGDPNVQRLRTMAPTGDPGPFDVSVTAEGYHPWRRSDLRRDECGLLITSPFHIWLLPEGEQ